MKIIVNLLAYTAAVLAMSYFISDVQVANFKVAFVAALIISILNTFIRPIIKLFALPITVMTLGLFSFVINASLILLASWLVEGFEVDGFFTAVIFSIVLSLVGWLLHKFEDKD